MTSAGDALASSCAGPARASKIREDAMTVAKITEISASSDRSFEDAVQLGIERASKTLKNIAGAWVKEQQVTVSGGKITQYRVNLKITFVLED